VVSGEFVKESASIIIYSLRLLEKGYSDNGKGNNGEGYLNLLRG